MSTRDDFKKFVKRYGSEFQNIQTVRLGNLSRDVETGTAGLLWARQWNGKEIQVINRANVPSDFDLRVLVGSTQIQPGLWFILLNMEDYLTPAAGGRIGYHRSQHEFGGPDELSVNRKQVTYFTVRVEDAAAFTVKVYGGVFPTENGPVQIDTQILDMSAQVIDAGAVFVNIESDASGTLSLNTGTVYGSPDIGTIDNVPATDPGKYLLAYVLFFDGQTELLDDHIVVPMPLGSVAKNAGLQISEAAADTPADGDKFGFWDIVDNALKSITWANIKTILNSLYSAIGHTHAYLTDAPSDGSIYGRKDGAWEIVASTGQYRQFVYEVSGGDLTFLTDDDGFPLFNLEDLE